VDLTITRHGFENVGNLHCNLRLGTRAVSLVVVGEMKNQLPVPENGTPKRPEQSAETVNPQIPSSRGFWALIVTQFQGAFSDNSLKWLVTFMVMGMGLPKDKRDWMVSIVAAVFALPFIVFSMTGGFFANRFSKRTVTIGVKCFEIFVMLLALAGLATHHFYLIISCVFLMGIHSAIFSPSKYGLLPELLPEKRLSWGNGVLELGTFLAIVGGTVAGGWLCNAFSAQPAWSGVILIGLAVLGLGTSFGITRVPAADPAREFRANFVADLWQQIRIIRQDRPLWLALLGNTYFFAIAALIQLLIVIYTTDALHISDPAWSSYLQEATLIGIGVGSFAAGYLSGGKIEYGLIPLGSIGLTISSALLGRHGISFGTAAFDLALFALFGGFYIVPISAMLQHRPAREQKGGVLAAASLLSWVGILLAAGVFYLLTVTLRLSPSTIFLLIAGVTFVSTIYLIWLLPDSLIRFLLWCMTHSFYRIRIEGRDNIPEKGGALFVCNHVSFVDGPLLMASTDRSLRFLIEKSYYELRWLNPFARALGLIPVSPTQSPRELIGSLRMASDAIRAGHVVCIFAEGGITRTGELLEFRRGFEHIMGNVDGTGNLPPIVPIALVGVWGSIFSFESGKFFWKWPRKFPYPVTIRFGKPLTPNATADDVRAAVDELINR
jgi:acyl-[acyl-carrier-protein]-phospholipid O-acyltransferase / long-chain-fatty-acid--[acyl-carrier-protein] ligase